MQYISQILKTPSVNPKPIRSNAINTLRNQKQTIRVLPEIVVKQRKTRKTRKSQRRRNRK